MIDKEDRKCLLFYDEAKLRIGDNENILVPFIRRYFPGYMVEEHQIDVLYSIKQCPSSEMPFWLI
jgi:hypothetical protein